MFSGTLPKFTAAHRRKLPLRSFLIGLCFSKKQLIVDMQRFARLMSTKAASHAPPIKIYGVHGKYAEAAYIAASKVSSVAISRPSVKVTADSHRTWLHDMRPQCPAHSPCIYCPFSAWHADAFRFSLSARACGFPLCGSFSAVAGDTVLSEPIPPVESELRSPIASTRRYLPPPPPPTPSH